MEGATVPPEQKATPGPCALFRGAGLTRFPDRVTIVKTYGRRDRYSRAPIAQTPGVEGVKRVP